jgi:hypothetical protein
VSQWAIRDFLVAVLATNASQAFAKRFPPPRDEEYSFHSICELYYVRKRVAVYRTPSKAGPVLFYMPRNYGVCITGVQDGWGIFGRIREAAHFTPFWGAVPDQGVDYGWIELSELEHPGNADESCKLRRGEGRDDHFEFPNVDSQDLGGICISSFNTIADGEVVVIFHYWPYVGQTYGSLAPSSLNNCVNVCRRDAKCKGFFMRFAPIAAI